MDGQDIQDDFKSLIDSLVSCVSFVFEFRIAKIDQEADLDSSCLQVVDNLGLVLGSDCQGFLINLFKKPGSQLIDDFECTADDFLRDFNKL